jgi:hypothetical protein
MTQELEIWAISSKMVGPQLEGDKAWYLQPCGQGLSFDLTSSFNFSFSSLLVFFSYGG